MARLWTIAGDKVLRGGVLVATILAESDGSFSWHGLGMCRVGFKEKGDGIIADVKYFHRHERRRRTTFTFKSGRTITV